MGHAINFKKWGGETLTTAPVSYSFCADTYRTCFAPTACTLTQPTRTGSGFRTHPHDGSRADGRLPALSLLISDLRLAP